MVGILARDVMVAQVIALPAEANLEDAARLMLERRVGSIVVTGPDGGIVGIVTENNFMAEDRLVPFSTITMPQLFKEWIDKGSLEEIYRRARSLKIKDVMSRRPYVAREDTPIEDVVDLMLRHNVKRIPIVRGTTCVGIVARRDLLKLLAGKRGNGSTAPSKRPRTIG